MKDQEIRIHNIALLYSVIKELHPDDFVDLAGVAKNYDQVVEEVREYLE